MDEQDASRAADTVLGFDYGTRKIGVAVGQSVTRTATPLAILPARRNAPDWTAIEHHIRQWQPDTLIVGLPLNMDDSESEMSARCRRFARQLHGRFGLPVLMVDERLSSFAVRQPQERGSVDDQAAAVITETWLSEPDCGLPP